MKIKSALTLLACLSAANACARPPASMEERFAQLEARLRAAEQRADTAEAEISALKNTRSEGLHPAPVVGGHPPPTTATATAPVVSAVPTLTLNNHSALKFYGDVEFNMDAASRTGSLTSLNTSGNTRMAPGKKERWDINGRILLGVDGTHRLENGKFSGFSVQPLADINGKMNLDDAVLFFGQQDDWQMKVGRYEAWDMFPLNQDTFIEYSGNTANDLYSDGYGYIYMMKEARGRSNSGGGALLSKTAGSAYFELNALVEDGSSLYVDNRYHGDLLENKKNVVYLRPVAAWRSGDYAIAAAMEKNIVSNAYGTQDANGEWHDRSQRTGYGLTLKRDTLQHGDANGTVFNLSTAFMDGKDEQNFSAGTNLLWQRIEAGYIFAHNKISAFNTDNYRDSCGDDCNILAPGNYDIHTLHASWHLPGIMDMPEFNIYLGAYASWLSSSAETAADNSRYGARLRFKYLF